MKCRVSSGEGEGFSTRRGFLEEAAQMEGGIGRRTKGKGIIMEEGKNWASPRGDGNMRGVDGSCSGAHWTSALAARPESCLTSARLFPNLCLMWGPHHATAPLLHGTPGPASVSGRSLQGTSGLKHGGVRVCTRVDARIYVCMCVPAVRVFACLYMYVCACTR